jgi:hypothetical protein
MSLHPRHFVDVEEVAPHMLMFSVIPETTQKIMSRLFVEPVVLAHL